LSVAAIYARYSSDEQRATSIDDQVRRCKALATQHGYDVKEEFVFADAAVTGSAEGLDRRVAYHRLLEAWEAKAFDALIVDEVSRLGRDVVEIAKLQVKVAKTGVRLSPVATSNSPICGRVKLLHRRWRDVGNVVERRAVGNCDDWCAGWRDVE